MTTPPPADDDAPEITAEPEPDAEAYQGPPFLCPHCGRVMSNREHAEQGACNDCHGGAWTSEVTPW